MRSSCETLAMKSRRVFSARSISVTSCRTATAPPSGVGAALTSKTRLGATEVALPLRGSRSLRAAQTQASTSGSRTAWTRACPGRVAPGAMRCMTEFEPAMRLAALTAMTASCMLSSRAVSSRCLDSRARKLASRRAAVASRAWVLRRSRRAGLLRRGRRSLPQRCGWRRRRCARGGRLRDGRGTRRGSWPGRQR